ncbi:MAG: hypothetical protein L0241_02895 [Planctomycetia bacterium]|nr:hypothetical protein [Planctomycetia bacterium]
MTGIGRVLALACCVLLALPPGWCCATTGGKCCGSALPLVPAPVSVECSTSQTCAGKTCAVGCCSKEPGNQCPEPAPKPQKPDRPCDTTCCEHPPTIAPKVEHSGIDLGPVGVQVTLTETASPEAVAALMSVPPRSAFPPLYILHCVWLC